MKRKKRKQLKKDEFVSTINKFVRFAQEKTKELMALFCLILIVVLIFFGVKLVTKQTEK